MHHVKPIVSVQKNVLFIFVVEKYMKLLKIYIFDIITVACSSDSTEGFCQHVDTTCSKENICKTCDTFAGMGGKCTHIDYFPNATIAEYGTVESGNVHAIMAEVYARGPVAATINASPIVNYVGGIYTNQSESKDTNHIVSIVGWGKDEESGKKHWIIRNSWGQYWGKTCSML